MTDAILRWLDRLMWGLFMVLSTASAIGHIRAGEDFKAALLIASVLIFATRFVDRPREGE